MTPARQSHPLRLGVLISGRGSNLLAIIEAIDRGELPATVALVVSNRAEAPGLEHARRRDLPVLIADRQTYPTRAARHGAIHAALDEARVELVICAGWSEILLPSLVNAYAGRMLNIHPSLVPAFGGGMHAQADALAHGVKITGCTVHFVTDEVDGGPIVIQRAVPVLDDDTVETLSARILAEEHRALPKAIRLFAENRLRIEGRRVCVLSTSPSSQAPSPSGRGLG